MREYERVERDMFNEIMLSLSLWSNPVL